MRKHFITVGMIVTCFILFAQTISAQCIKDGRVKGVDYAQALFYEEYEYIGQEEETSGYKVTLTYPMNEDGVYQVRSESKANSITYVYQITDEGLYALAEFPDDTGDMDYRQHENTLDEVKALLLPSELKKGDTFFAGYGKKTAIEVDDILAEYQQGDKVFKNVVVLKFSSKEYEWYTYYAPHIGSIGARFENMSSDTTTTTVLFKYDKPVDLSGTNLDLCQEN